MAGAPGRDQLKAMERLVRIIAVLNEAGSVGASRDQLITVGGYGEADPGTQLNNDFNHLRKQGWQIDNVAGAGETGRYRMVSGDNRLRLRLNPAQLAALQRAVILSDRADLAHSLGVQPGSLPPGVGSEVLPHDENEQLTLALRAVRLRSRIRFSYKGTTRLLHPATVRLQNYQWYLSGVEDGTELVKHFAVNRMSEATLDQPGTAQPVPEVRRIPLHPLRWEIDPPVDVTLRSAPEFLPDVERWLMAADDSRELDATVHLVYRVTNRQAFRSRIYVLGQRVAVVGPQTFRDEMLTELRDLVGA